MYLCLRVDMDYVPWDTPDARDYGHGEPASLLKLLDLARTKGYRFHFFASNRNLRAFPAGAEAVLNDGHDLDWLCKHPEAAEERHSEAIQAFAELGHEPMGMAIRGPWEPEYQLQIVQRFQFLSCAEGPYPEGVRSFPTTKSDREAQKAGQTARIWTDCIKATLREHASRNIGTVVCVRPQVLSKFDPKLVHIQEMLALGLAVGLRNRTLRQLAEE